jgi:PTS system mannose-specific IID component/fructoselysine and glucoselysine-specific PTS system IID component
MYTLIRRRVKTGWLLTICILGGIAVNALGLLV